MSAESASRRDFLKATAAAGTLAALPNVHAAGSDMLRVGLVGCGDRGTGAASQALAADANVKLVAMADAFDGPARKQPGDPAEDTRAIAAKVDVRPDASLRRVRRLPGADRQRGRRGAALHAAALPPASTSARRSRPASTSSPRSPWPSMPPACARCSRAASWRSTKGLSVVSGLCLRYDNGFRETVRRIHDGAIGEVVALFANDYRSGRWDKPRQPGWTDMTTRCATGTTSPGCRATSTSSSTSTSSTSAPG